MLRSSRSSSAKLLVIAARPLKGHRSPAFTASVLIERSLQPAKPPDDLSPAMLALLPGDALPSTSHSPAHAALHLGPGLTSTTSAFRSSSSAVGKGKQRATDSSAAEERGRIAATRAGLLGEVHQGDKDRYWIEGVQKRVRRSSSLSLMERRQRGPNPIDSRPRVQYVPHPPEPVLGIIIARHAEGYRVDIGSSQAAALDALAFEGATKRNKPNLKVSAGDYVRVSPVSRS